MSRIISLKRSLAVGLTLCLTTHDFAQAKDLLWRVQNQRSDIESAEIFPSQALTLRATAWNWAGTFFRRLRSSLLREVPAKSTNPWLTLGDSPFAAQSLTPQEIVDTLRALPWHTSYLSSAIANNSRIERALQEVPLSHRQKAVLQAIMAGEIRLAPIFADFVFDQDNGKAVVIGGSSGMGKSLLSAYFIRASHWAFGSSDYLLLISYKDQQFVTSDINPNKLERHMQSLSYKGRAGYDEPTHLLPYYENGGPVVRPVAKVIHLRDKGAELKLENMLWNFAMDRIEDKPAYDIRPFITSWQDHDLLRTEEFQYSERLSLFERIVSEVTAKRYLDWSMPRKPNWSNSSMDPKKHNPKHFRYLIHGVATQEHKHALAELAARTGQRDDSKQIDLLVTPEMIAEKPLISTCLIDQDHTTTRDSIGFILEVPESNIMRTYDRDQGTMFLNTHNMEQDLLYLSPEGLLKDTHPEMYNEVLIKGISRSGNVVRITGVFVRLDKDGFPEDPKMADQIKALAHRNGWPVVELTHTHVAVKAKSSHIKDTRQAA